MTAIVDKATCIGCGLCADTCPEVFEMVDGIAAVKKTPVPAGAEASCKQAADNCPVTAITLQ